MQAAQNAADRPPQPAPPKDRPGKPTPPRIAEILAIVSILTTYACHLAETLEQRAVARGFATVARFFGTVAIDTILAHLHRGLMRAIALEHLLLRRAARGRDLRVLAPRAPSHRTPPNEAPTPAQPEAPTPPATLTPEPNDPAAQPAAPDPTARRARRIAGTQPLTLDTLPSMDAIEAQVRRSPVGRTIAAICRDLGISPALCDGTFWNRLFNAIRLYRGNLSGLVLEVTRREQRFENEEWKHPGLELPEETRAGIRRVLGFMIGETLADPSAVMAPPGACMAAAATGPP